MKREFVRVELFDALWHHFGLSDKEARELELTLLSDPKTGDVIQGTGGLRKMRYSPSKHHRGKSSSYRICYLDIEHNDQIILIFMFIKDKQENLTDADKQKFKAMVKLLKNEYQ